ncbi:MAG: site-2 protease family protein [Candidatus Helarchaeota archaeon]
MEKFHQIIAKYYEIVAERLDRVTFRPIFVIKPIQDPKEMNTTFNHLYSEIQRFHFIPKLDSKLKNLEPFADLPPDSMYLFLEPQIYEEGANRNGKRNRIWINWVLFITTIITVVISGYFYVFMFDPIHGGVNKPWWESLFYIVLFTGSILGIIGAHELGHVYALNRYQLKPSMPYFIPAIPPLGTFGAFVSQKDPPKNRNQLFDIGIMGPLFGFVVALICVVIGLLLTRAIPTPEFLTAYQTTHNAFFNDITLSEAAERIANSFNNYNLFIYLFRQGLFGQITEGVYYGQILPDSIIQIHPLAFGGWIGLLLTAINLLPAGKLDGGHVARALLGKSYWVATIIGLILLAFIDIYMVFILFLLGGFSWHEGPLNDSIPISKNRKIAYIGVLLIICLSLPMSPLINIYGFL